MPFAFSTVTVYVPFVVSRKNIGHALPCLQSGASDIGIVNVSVPSEEVEIFFAATRPSSNIVFSFVNPEPVIKMLVPTAPEFGEMDLISTLVIGTGVG